MKAIEVFGKYAMAFEEAVRMDDWSVLEPFFAEDAVYETIGPAPFAGRYVGREAVLAHFKKSLDRFDRRFDARENPEVIEGPRVDDDSVWIRWRLTYRVDGAPPLVLEGEETAVVEDGRIRRLEDLINGAATSRVENWMAEHADKLRG